MPKVEIVEHLAVEIGVRGGGGGGGGNCKKKKQI